MNKNIKKILFKLITIKPVNLVLVGVLSIFRKVTPSSKISRFPKVGSIKYILPNLEKVIMYSDGGDSIASKLFWEGINSYESETMAVYFKLLESSNVIFDIGANSGIFSIIAACYNRNNKVFAFEPVRRNFDYLLKNKEENDLLNLEPVCCAVSNINGKISFNIQDSVFLPLGGSIRNDVEQPDDKIEVDAITLDAFMKINGNLEVDLMKIDTEGVEDRVLEGARGLLTKSNPVIICEVLPVLSVDKIQAILEPLGYGYYNLTDKGLVKHDNIISDKDLLFKNYLFITDGKFQKKMRELSV